MKPSVSVEEIGPTQAQAILSHNDNNRNLRETTWRRYARDMVNGEWLFNGESIKLNGDQLLDGQHRLRAIVEAGVTIPLVVVRGLRSEAQQTVDRGLARNAADALRLNGETNVNKLAGAIAQAFMLRNGRGQVADAWPSTREVVLYLEEYPHIRESVRFVDPTAVVLRTPTTTLAALHHLFSDLDEQDANTFVERLGSGANLKEDDPIFVLRETLIREWAAPRRMTRIRLQALMIKSWNAWRKGQSIRLLKWKTGGTSPESFPKPE